MRSIFYEGSTNRILRLAVVITAVASHVLTVINLTGINAIYTANTLSATLSLQFVQMLQSSCQLSYVLGTALSS